MKIISLKKEFTMKDVKKNTPQKMQDFLFNNIHKMRIFDFILAAIVLVAGIYYENKWIILAGILGFVICIINPYKYIIKFAKSKQANRNKL